MRGALEKLGFTNVQSVISSGNVLFESRSKNVEALEARIEAAWPKLLGFTATTLVRSQEQLQHLVDAEPYKGITHTANFYLLVTFFKKPTKIASKLPYQPEGKPYKLLSVLDNTLFTTTDNTLTPTTDLMTWLERQFTKENIIPHLADPTAHPQEDECVT